MILSAPMHMAISRAEQAIIQGTAKDYLKAYRRQVIISGGSERPTFNAFLQEKKPEPFVCLAERFDVEPELLLRDFVDRTAFTPDQKVTFSEALHRSIEERQRINDCLESRLRDAELFKRDHKDILADPHLTDWEKVMLITLLK